MSGLKAGVGAIPTASAILMKPEKHEIKCSKHPRYKAIRPPRTNCLMCFLKYWTPRMPKR
jgi:hypothetical protein